MLTLMAWAFTRISVLGVWRYLGNVDEVKSTFSFCVIFERNKVTTKNYNDYEKVSFGGSVYHYDEHDCKCYYD